MNPAPNVASQSSGPVHDDPINGLADTHTGLAIGTLPAHKKALAPAPPHVLPQCWPNAGGTGVEASAAAMVATAESAASSCAAALPGIVQGPVPSAFA